MLGCRSACHFPSRRSPDVWEGQEIEEAAEYKYLGIVLQGDLRWKNQVERVVAKGRRALGMLGRVLNGVSCELLEKAYGTMVRPMLEYAAAVWDVEVEVQELEKVQRKAAKWVKGRWRRQGQDDEEGNYRPSVMMKEMGWSSLKDRRKVERLVRMYRMVNEEGGWGGLHCKLSKGVFRGNNSEKLQSVWRRTERGSQSMLVRSVREWNVLREELVSVRGIGKFRKGVEKELVGRTWGMPKETAALQLPKHQQGRWHSLLPLTGSAYAARDGGERDQFWHAKPLLPLTTREYAAAVLGPYVEVEVRELGKVQIRAARWMKGRWIRQGQDDEEERNYRPSVMMKEMGWSSLRGGRKVERLVKMYRVVNEEGGLHCKLSKGVFRGRGNNSEKFQSVWRRMAQGRQSMLVKSVSKELVSVRGVGKFRKGVEKELREDNYTSPQKVINITKNAVRKHSSTTVKDVSYKLLLGVCYPQSFLTFKGPIRVVSVTQNNCNELAAMSGNSVGKFNITQLKPCLTPRSHTP
ncbi:hypothetical protein PR048_012948 [Dryococelus australis]|uniref:Reverse transcriptase n=1 Tax=Dryococelus australis TaxID=614101 RepID=A0ABQ9HQY2_9NEOP|nr:hypothetical protein PR048_012948 [Dryococelus australis]